MKVFDGKESIIDASCCERCYLAGLVDGEGAIDFGGLSPRIRIGMMSILPWELGEKYGGYVTKRSKEGKIVYTWNISKRLLLKDFIDSIISYSKIKQRQLELMLEAIEILDKKLSGWKESIKNIKREIKRLNKLSPPDIPLE